MPDDISTIDLEGMGKEVQTRQGEIEDKEDEMFEDASPKGKFSDKALNVLVGAANRLTPLFGIADTYPSFPKGTSTTLPAEFVRLISMFSAAIGDAIEAGILPDDAGIDLAVITDDNGIQALAGRINMAAKDARFKRFLKSGASPGTAPPTPQAEERSLASEEMSEEETADLFASRV